MAKSKADKFKRMMIPVHVREDSIEDKPFVVAFENVDRYPAGHRLSEDEFNKILKDYDSVIVHCNEGDHPSQKDKFLLYNEAQGLSLQEADVEEIEGRDKSKELKGRFKWFNHGKNLDVDLSIGLHCLDNELWERLP